MSDYIYSPRSISFDSLPNTGKTWNATMSKKNGSLAPFHLAEMLMPYSRRVLLHSESPSTGKSYLATFGGLREGQKVYTVQVQEDGSTADLLGCYVLRDKEMVWSHGVGIRAWIDGARLVIDELDHASAEVRSFLHRLLDDPEFAQITLPTGEIVRPAEGFQVVATMNGQPEDLPEALRSRFPVVIEMTEPNPAAIQALPDDLQVMARNTAVNNDPDRRITLRVWYEFAKLRKLIGKEAAAQACFQHRAQEILDGLMVAR